jgi:hypothetical protein
MPCSTRIELPGPHEHEQLLAFLRGRGLDGRIVGEGELEVGYARDEAMRLRADVWSALRSWVAEHPAPLVPVSAAEDVCVLRLPGE